MTIDDPKLTAYALGELDDAADRAAVEAFLATDESARRLVDETRQAAALLTRGLAAAEHPSLTAAQKQSIAAASTAGALPYATPSPRRPMNPWARRILATAACAAIAAAGVAVLTPSLQKARRVASSLPQPRGQATLTHSNENKYGDFGIVAAAPRLEKGVKETEGLARSTPSNSDYFFDAKQQHSAVTRFGNQPNQADGWNTTLGGAPAAASDPNSVMTGTQSLSRAGDATTDLSLQKEYRVDRYAKLPAPAPAAGAPAVANRLYDPNAAWGDGLSVDGTATVRERLYAETPATPNPDALPALQEAQKKLDAGLGDVRAALARQDRPAAVAGLAKARGELNQQLAYLTPQEIARANARVKQLEDAVSANESYAVINDNPYLGVADQPLSTFSIDVDTGSYSNVRRFLNQGQLPPPDAVRIEELLNYFPYDYPTPKPDDKTPFAATVEVATCPWDTTHRLARVAIKGREIAHDKRPVSNLVFLIDVSGSMNEPRKLPLVKEGLKRMVNELTENDRVAIVVYAGAAGLVLPSTNADPKNREAILAAIDNLSAGGSTNGGHGIELAYRVATESFIKGGTNRVLLATDGDWNVGITDQTSLTRLIEDKAKSGVFLSILGFGYGNLKDATLEKLADKGNGHYAYIDDLKEARKVLVEEMSGTLVTIAKDVKVQVEFNPAQVKSYRLIGYENRMLRKEDFNNDKVDAGEIGAGHRVTALYEIVPAGAPAKAPATRPAVATDVNVDPLKYQTTAPAVGEVAKELLTLKLRYKQPDGDKSTKLEVPVADAGTSYAKASDDFKFASAVAQFGMILRNSPYKGSASIDGVLELGDEGKGKDEKGYRAEFLEMVRKAQALSK